MGSGKEQGQPSCRAEAEPRCGRWAEQSGWRAGFSGHSPTRMRSRCYPGAGDSSADPCLQIGRGGGLTCLGCTERLTSSGSRCLLWAAMSLDAETWPSLLEGLSLSIRGRAGCSLFPMGQIPQHPVTAGQSTVTASCLRTRRSHVRTQGPASSSRAPALGSWALCLLSTVGVGETAVGIPNEHGLGRGSGTSGKAFCLKFDGASFQLHLQKERKDGDVCDQFQS